MRHIEVAPRSAVETQAAIAQLLSDTRNPLFLMLMNEAIILISTGAAS